jgi:hypothetical protein
MRQEVKLENLEQERTFDITVKLPFCVQII